MPSDGKSSHCLWQGELKSYTFGHLFILEKNLAKLDLEYKFGIFPFGRSRLDLFNILT